MRVLIGVGGGLVRPARACAGWAPSARRVRFPHPKSQLADPGSPPQKKAKSARGKGEREEGSRRRWGGGRRLRLAGLLRALVFPRRRDGAPGSACSAVRERLLLLGRLEDLRDGARQPACSCTRLSSPQSRIRCECLLGRSTAMSRRHSSGQDARQRAGYEMLSSQTRALTIAPALSNSPARGETVSPCHPSSPARS